MKNIIKNKKAYHDYFIEDKIETGIILKGFEVKSIRNGQCNLKGSYCKFFKNELFAFEIHISKYHNSNNFYQINETRERKLLLKRKELNKIQKKIDIEGYTLVPLEIYFNENNKCKLLMGICKGKKDYDKRHSLKEKDIQKNLNRNFKNKK